MADSDAGRPLRKISTAFKELAAAVNSPSQDVPVGQFSHACSLVSPLFGCLGIAFKFAEMDYVAKVWLSSSSILESSGCFEFENHREILIYGSDLRVEWSIHDCLYWNSISGVSDEMYLKAEDFGK